MHLIIVPTLTSEDSPSSLGGGIEDYHEVEYFTKAYTEEVADALHSKTRNFNQTEQYTPRLMIVFTPCPPNLV